MPEVGTDAAAAAAASAAGAPLATARSHDPPAAAASSRAAVGVGVAAAGRATWVTNSAESIPKNMGFRIDARFDSLQQRIDLWRFSGIILYLECRCSCLQDGIIHVILPSLHLP